jgi:hypothetical protein
MKAENISRGLVSDDVSVRWQESAEKSGEDFGSLLVMNDTTVAENAPYGENLPGPMALSVASACPSVDAVDFGQAVALYHRNSVSCPSSESENSLAATESGPPGLGAERTAVQTGPAASSPSDSPSAFSQVMDGIKGFFSQLFSPQNAPAYAAAPMVRDVGDKGPLEGERAAQWIDVKGNDENAAPFFNKVLTVLTFGLWHSGDREDPGKVSASALSTASDAATVGAENELDGQISASSRQNLPSGKNAAANLSIAGGAGGAMRREVVAKIQKAIQDAAIKHDLSADLIAAVIKVESNFNPHAISKEGAGGLMQLMPSTARKLAVKDRFDISENIDAGARYLKTLLERFDGKVDLALAAYNAGPEAVEKYRGVPPYQQTRRYLKEVMRYS